MMNTTGIQALVKKSLLKWAAVKTSYHKCNMKYKYSVMPMKYSDGYDMHECKCGKTEKKNKTSTLHEMFD